MRALKRNWTMILLDDSHRVTGVYQADTGVIKNLSLRFEELEKSRIAAKVNSSFAEILSYLRSDGKVKALLKEKLRVEDGKILLEAQVRAFESVEILPVIEIDYKVWDTLQERGFSPLKERRLSKGNSLYYSGKGIKIFVKEIRDLNGKKLSKGELWSGKLEVEISVSVEDERLFKLLRPLNAGNSAFDKFLVGTDFGAVPVAGIPWYATFFGRDLLFSSLLYMEEKPDIVRNTLMLVSHLQSRTFNDKTDAQPGKIFHETRLAVSSVEEDNPLKIYYGSIDATLLFPTVAWEYLKKTKDIETIQSILPNLEMAITWAREYGDADGDGFIEYKTRGTLRNKGWKDSDDAIVYPNGDRVKGPIALVEVQGYLYRALISMAQIYEKFGMKQEMEIMEKDARNLKDLFESSFKTRGFFALALDGKKKRVETPTSNPAHALMTGIYSKEDATTIVDRIFKEDLLTPFGVRTLSSSVKAFHPVSYHRGTIWPHDNAAIVLGLLEYGFKEEARELARRILRVSKHFGGKLPELFVYIDGTNTPLPYPGACDEQLWAYAAQKLLEKIYRG